jgi:hypothetical protein
VARVGQCAVVSCDGTNATAHARQLREVCPAVIRAFVLPELERAAASAIAAVPAQPDAAEQSLGERCASWCEREAAAHRVPDASRVAWYHAVAVRGGRPLGIRTGNHCASAQSRALVEVLRPGEAAPHEPRAGAKELLEDARAGGRWHAVSEARGGAWKPRRGDLAIYDRSVPGRPETAWWGHVDRVLEACDSRFRCLGANEGPGGAWREEWTPYLEPRLLGFVEVDR